MKYSEKWGDSVDGAVELALKDLQLTIDQVKVTVLEEPSKGFLGIGSKLAKVRVEEIVPEKEVKMVFTGSGNKAKTEKSKEVKAEAKAEAKGEKSPKQKPQKEKKEKKNKEIDLPEDFELVSTRPTDLEEVGTHIAKDFLTNVARDMGIEINIKVFTNKDSVYVDIDGKDTGTVIGKRGATLDSIQYLTSLVVNKDKDDYVRVVVDAEGYREKREKTLEELAVRLADKAVKTGKSVRLEPMNPYERKVIHTTLQKIENVTTKSEGSEPFRKVVIVPARK
ncbi:MAG: RNA-binding cell elongation regulator Jag/EloR [Bacillota bacterium]|nr:RNA-binding cell elongation regulator Jag/EloR [Bacillota bacterium]